MNPLENEEVKENVFGRVGKEQKRDDGKNNIGVHLE
jgi:hypothetical protein